MRDRISAMVLAAVAFLLLSTEDAQAMRKHFGRAANPTNGAALPGANVTVLRAGSATPANIFADAKGVIPLKNPVQADASGHYSFYAPNGQYRIRVTSATELTQMK